MTTYSVQDTNITLGCAISGSNVIVTIESPDPIHYESGSPERPGILMSRSSAHWAELCQGSPTKSEPQLDCSDVIVEHSDDGPANYHLGFGTLEAGWSFTFQKYVSGSWVSLYPTTQCPFPAIGNTLQWRIEAKQGSTTRYFDPYIVGDGDCNIEQPTSSTD